MASPMLHGRDWNLSGSRLSAPAGMYPCACACLTSAQRGSAKHGSRLDYTFEGAVSTAALSFPAIRPHPGPVISRAACRLELPGGQMRARCHPHLPPQQSEMAHR